MIKGFSEETQPLTEYERKVILPIILESLKTKIGKANAVTNKYIISRLRDSYKIDAKGKGSAGLSCAITHYTAAITRAYLGSRLCFYASRLARYAGNQFTDLYEQILIEKL
jgi:hypothetical protein